MHCPFCGETDTKVIDSRLVAAGNQVRRRRQCQNPAWADRFTTFESAELMMPRVIRSNGNRQQVDEGKLRTGMLRALQKRPVSIETIESTLNQIKHQLQRLGEREIKSRVVGELVMSALRDLDDVAYVRFASVYRSFQDVNEFKKEVDRLDRDNRQRTPDE